MKQHPAVSRGFIRRRLRGITWLLLIGGSPAFTGCYGSFPLTHGIYEVNGAVGGDSLIGRVIQTLVFWAFVIIPVYGIGMFLDAIIFNLIEFWTGDTIRVSEMEASDGKGMHAKLSPSEDGKEAHLVITQDGDKVLDQRFVKISPTEFEVRDENNALVGRVLNEGNGKLRMTDANSKTLRVIDAREANPLKGVTAEMSAPAGAAL